MSSFKNIVKNIKNDYLYNLINIHYLSKDENYHNKLKNIVLNIRKIQTSKFNFLIKDVNVKFYHENIDNFQNKEKTKKFIRNNLDIIKIDFIRIISNGYMGDKKRYKCLNCKIKLDRDINASINIYKKGLPIATMGK